MNYREEKGFFIPEKIIAIKEKSDSFTGEIVYLTYKDERGKLVRQKDLPKGEQLIFDNIPVSKFVINKTVSEIKNEYCAFHGITLYDENREVEFQISSANLHNLCRFGDIHKGDMTVECIIAFSNKGYPILLPTSSQQYIKAKKFTEKRNSDFNGELKVGHIYSLKKKTNKVIYMGKMKIDKNLDAIDHYTAQSVLFSEINNHFFSINHRTTLKDTFAVLNKDNINDVDLDNYYSVEFSGVSLKSIHEDEGEIPIEFLGKLKNLLNERHTQFGLNKTELIPIKEIKSKNTILYKLFSDDENGEEIYYAKNLHTGSLPSPVFGIKPLGKLKLSCFNGILLYKKNELSLVTKKHLTTDEKIISDNLKNELKKLTSSIIDSKTSPEKNIGFQASLTNSEGDALIMNKIYLYRADNFLFINYNQNLF